MRRQFEELRENLDEFVEQTAYPMLVVACLSDELAYVVKFLQSLEEKHKEAYFVIFPHAFVSPAAYVDGVVENLRLKVEDAAQSRAERGDPPFPPLPPELADTRRPAQERLRRVLEYLRQLSPREPGHAVVVGLLPLECRDYEGHRGLIESVMPVADVPDWMASLRIVVCEDRLKRHLLQSMAARKVDKVLTLEVDFSTPALTDALTRDASDTSIAVPERMDCLMQLAALDYSYQRFPDALEKYGLLYKYYEGLEVPLMQALCLLGAGDTLRAAGQPVVAKGVLQRGIALAMATKVLPVLLNLLVSVTELCLELGHNEDAESYADSGVKVAAASLSPFAYADLHEKRGDAQIAQGRFVDGIVTYKRCEELCKMYDYHHRWKAVLRKEITLFEQSGQTRDRREAKQTLAAVEELERRGGRRGVGKPDGEKGQVGGGQDASASKSQPGDLTANERDLNGARV